MDLLVVKEQGQNHIRRYGVIPPRNFNLAWGVFYDKIPTQEELQVRGHYLASRCKVCHSTVKTQFTFSSNVHLIIFFRNRSLIVWL